MTQQFDRRRLLGLAATAGISAFALPAFAAAPKPLHLSEADWHRRLSSKEFAVLRKGATERPFSSPLNDEHRKGIFKCAGCALPLYSSKTKFKSGTGWPSFYDHLPGAIHERRDSSLGMTRTEVRCARCDGHLGHVFDDGPKPTGLRYCMNGLALDFTPA